ncbi:hypothetical protein C8D90_10671 [Enterobacillus tribolii]|uniref:Uncharacterized protein n=1 Tax=Enterobacillus tribolii TaxID=1487935 RepID=A0A370QNC9_9GAMM|nr:hypothetical protein C8D90_10671 [Enterobacillus tribolii]
MEEYNKRPNKMMKLISNTILVIVLVRRFILLSVMQRLWRDLGTRAAIRQSGER